MRGHVVLVVLAVLAAAAPAASAQQPGRRGVSVDLASIVVDETMVPGGSYRLPPLRVRNPGTAPTRYAMAARPGGEGLEPPPDWVSFTPASFDLAPGDDQRVDIEVVVPPGARDGAYTALLAAQVVDTTEAGDNSTARVGAAAATRLGFEVVPASLWSGWMNALRRWWAEAAPWSWLALAALGLGAAGLWLSRRYEIHVERVR